MPESKNTISVTTLLSLYANSLSSTMDGQIIVVEGFFSDNNNKLYGQYYYDEIISKEKQHKITIQITQSVKSKLASGNYYNFQGYISRGQSLDNDSRLKVFFRVTKILKHEEEVQLIKLESLIEDSHSSIGCEKLKILEEIKILLKNKSLDLKNNFGVLEMPIIIHASIWNCKEVFELLLSENIEILKKVNFYKIFGEFGETDYCKDEEVNCLEILNEKQSVLLNLLNENDIHSDAYSFFNKDLKSVKDCITLIKNYLVKSEINQ